jgi:acylphosphatase
MLELHTIFHGKVQGVGFRSAAHRFAQSLNLVGFVRNLPDGSVELLAQGPEDDLKKLLHQLRQNFTITHTKEKFSFLSKSYTSFQITE